MVKVIRNLAVLAGSLAAIMLLTFVLLNNFVYIHKPLQTSLDSTVLITSDNGQRKGYGTGVIFKNGQHTFVWTCFHVIHGNIDLKVDYDLHTQKYLTKFHSTPIKVSTKLFNSEPAEIGELTLMGKLIRFSMHEDLALIEIPNGYFRNTVEFPRRDGYTPLAGSQLFHIGNFGGPDGEKSVSNGITGVQGYDLDGDGILYDRVGLSLQGGSSGGGVFEASTGNCIGLMARTVNRQHMNQGLIIPFRRMVNFARSVDCPWALSSTRVPENYQDTLTRDIWEVPESIQNLLRNVPD